MKPHQGTDPSIHPNTLPHHFEFSPPVRPAPQGQPQDQTIATHSSNEIDTYKPQKSAVLPHDLLYETQQTLALLLPARSRSDCKTWFSRIRKRYPDTIDLEAADFALGPYGRVQAKFPYWHERLSIIQRRFDEEEPKGLSQWWHDRRKKVQWYTFWVAILILVLTVVFGLIQSITGVMQVYAAYYPVSSG